MQTPFVLHVGAMLTPGDDAAGSGGGAAQDSDTLWVIKMHGFHPLASKQGSSFPAVGAGFTEFKNIHTPPREPPPRCARETQAGQGHGFVQKLQAHVSTDACAGGGHALACLQTVVPKPCARGAGDEREDSQQAGKVQIHSG